MWTSYLALLVCLWLVGNLDEEDDEDEEDYEEEEEEDILDDEVCFPCLSLFNSFSFTASAYHFLFTYLPSPNSAIPFPYLITYI